MRKFIVKKVVVVLVLLTSTIAFAQGDFGDPADPNPTDAPIGDYIWILGIVGLVYVFFKMKSRTRVASS